MMRSISAIAFGLMLLAAGCAQPKATVPTGFVTYVAIDKAFKCDAPGGWTIDSSASGATQSGVTFKSADATISIDSDEAGALMSDALSSPTTAGLVGGGNMTGSTPVDKLHALKGTKFAQDVDGYTELSTASVKIPYGQARVSEYTAKDVHGYRVTILGPQRSITVICHCSPSQWASLYPAFLRVIESVTAGPG